MANIFIIKRFPLALWIVPGKVDKEFWSHARSGEELYGDEDTAMYRLKELIQYEISHLNQVVGIRDFELDAAINNGGEYRGHTIVGVMDSLNKDQAQLTKMRKVLVDFERGDMKSLIQENSQSVLDLCREEILSEANRRNREKSFQGRLVSNAT